MNTIAWSEETAEKLRWKLPSVKCFIVGSLIHNASLQFLLWNLNDASLQTTANHSQASTVHLVAECYLSFHKLLGKDFQIVHKDGREY